MKTDNGPTRREKKKIFKTEPGHPLTVAQQRAIQKGKIIDGIADYSEIHAKDFVRWLHSTNKISKTHFFNKHIDKIYHDFMDTL